MRTAEDSVRPPLGRPFLVVWFGQTVSEVGSMLAGIGVAIHVFVTTGSAAWLGVLAAVAALPFLLATPLATLVDRFPRRRVILVADVGAAAGPATALVLAASGRLEVWHLVVAGFIGGLGTAIQLPASQAAVPALAAPGALDRANALKQLGPAIGIVAGPVIAGPLVVHWGLEAVLLVDLATFAVGLVTVLAVPFEDHRDEHPVADDGSWSAVRSWLTGAGRPLLTLMALTAMINFVMALFNVSVLTLATEVGGAGRAGFVLAAGGLAMLVASVIAAQRGVRPDRVAAFRSGLVVVGVGLAITAARPSLLLVIVGVAVSLAAVPVMNAAMTTIYHERVPATMQGRVFALRGAIGQSLNPIGSLAAGLLIAHVTAPAMSEGGRLTGTLGSVIGAGADRGAAALLLVCAALLAAVVVWLRASGPARSLTRWAQRPDAVVSAPEAEPPADGSPAGAPRAALSSADR